ncbi:MAG: polyphenol oxidase family protein [bacterium]
MPLTPNFSLADTASDWLVGQFTSFSDLPGIVHLVTTRMAPALDAEADSTMIAATVSLMADTLNLAEMAWCRQVHGAEVLVVDRGGIAGEADSLVTATPGLGLLGRSADCPLILAAGPMDEAGASPVHRQGLASPAVGEHPRFAVGFAHASWRSTVAGITTRMIERLGSEFGVQPATIKAGICPSAGPCCYEVGDEVRSAAVADLGGEAARFFHRRGQKYHFDLWQANSWQLREAGVPADQIASADLCTICRNDLFPSYRVEGQAAGRFGAMVGILPTATP